ncbi:MAG: YgiT-type zinc finger protein [Chloroflexi bacterium]|nr:YgiT-type zinc finger protein [Chloroflexota bacterium]
MECLYCKGTLARKKVSYTVTRRGYHMIIDDVPAWVCQQCGEPLFEEKAVDAMQGILSELDQRVAGLVAIPVFA